MNGDLPSLIDRKQIASLAGVSVRTIRRLERDINLRQAQSRISRHPLLFKTSLVRQILSREGVHFNC
jgi:phage terminase Nu1 subunit (DNA packaging protein)